MHPGVCAMACPQQQFTEQEKRDLRFVFQLYASEEASQLGASDVLAALRLLGFRTARATVVELLHSQSSGGRQNTTNAACEGVSFDGFLDIVARLQGSSYDVHEEIAQAFQQLGGEEGYLSMGDLKRACADLKLKLNHQELQEMMEEADTDGDGRVSKEEFIKVMLRTPLFLSIKT